MNTSIMGSYTDVKNLIISNIKTNGQREITGQILQDVLLNMLENSSRVEEITYSDLKALRDGAKLTPSRLYRITDYITTTVQSNTKSAGHPFDVIVLAISETELLEQAWAIQHEGDEYFANSNLSAWKIWYCLNNDTDRFAWADEENGKGVIYRMIDEWNNDIPYDFKNIQFTHPKDTTTYPHYYYTFASGNVENNTDYSIGITKNCYSNTIKEYIYSGKRTLNQIIFIGINCYSNSFNSDCYNNTFGANCYSNSFGNYCRNNFFDSNCYDNSFDSNCDNNSFDSNCDNNSFDSNCDNNSFGSNCSFNSFGSSCSSNSFGTECHNNTLGPNCLNNSFVSYCDSNSFGSGCHHNAFNSDCYNNTFCSYCHHNSFNSGCDNNVVASYDNNITLSNDCRNNSFGSNCSNIKFASDSSVTIKYNYYQYNHFGDGCKYILFKGTETASSTTQVQNYNFAQGLQGTSGEYLTIDGKRNRSYETYISKDSDGTIKESVIAEKLDKIIETTYAKLVSLRDSSNLIPGQQYRITDYQCITTQTNTKSAGHVFDIIVTADTVNTLNEVARAIQHDGDAYFANSDLNAWQIWYSLDNDTTRFAWADSTNGKGVIYRMIDEFNNDIPYDFKNIQFKYPNNSNTNPYYYTFASSNAQANTDCSLSISNKCYSNTIMRHIPDGIRRLNHIIFIGAGCDSNTFEKDCRDNTLWANCHSNFFGVRCAGNTLRNYCANNTFANSCLGNTLGEFCRANTFGTDSRYNTLGNRCNFNTFGNSCSDNTLGNYCYCNTFESDCSYIKFASDKSASTKYNYYKNNHFGDGCKYILFKGIGTDTPSDQVQNYNFAQGLRGTSSAYLTIDGVRNRAYETYISRDTDGTIKESVIAEFENRLGNCVDLTTEQTINAAKTFSAGIDLNGTRISKVGSPINTDDAANKEYVDDAVKTVDDKVNDFKNAGYLYAGVATSLTNPGSPDTKVFYIANGKGEYTNFGGLDVTEDDVVILYYDTAWHKVATGIASNEKLAELSDYAHKDEVRHIERDLGMYPELEPVPLNPEVTGKYINSDGKYVDASDWNIASIGAVYLGNTYLLNMVSSSNMVLGVALFVSRVYKRDNEGNIIGTILTPLFSAKNTSIPASGYVLFEAMDDYDEVLICYKPALATQMLVARWGFKASHATQLRNLRLIVDNKTDFEGIYELLTAGYALNLVGKGNGEPQAFMSRKTGGGNITDGSAVIKEVDGVQPIVWNQMVKSPSQSPLNYMGSNISISGNTVTFRAEATGTGAFFYPLVIVGGHKYFCSVHIKTTSLTNRVRLVSSQFTGKFVYCNETTEWQKIESLGTAPASVKNAQLSVLDQRESNWDDVQMKNLIVIDLTQMFGAGNEPSTYEEYLDRISHYHIKDAYAYNAGEVVNYKGVGIKTTNIDDTKSYIRDWSEVMKKYFPDGMTSLNGVKDFFDDKKAVRKYGVVDLGEFEWDAYSANRFRTRTDIEDIKLTDATTVANIFAPNYKAVIKEWVEQADMQISVDGRYIMVCRSSVADATALKAAMQGVKLYYELAEPVEDIFDKPLNLTYTVINGGTETSLATENSTQFEGSIAYNKDYVAVVDELQMQNRVTQIEFENWEN